jgi:predicted glycosyltransferase involved in capsule biosynthesis
MVSKDCRFTIGYTYYNEPHLLEKQIEYWNNYPHQIQIILIDDGSELYPAKDVLKDFTYPNFQLWRIEKDLGFNSHGCRNLIAHISESDNILFMDIDCFMSPENVSFLKKCNFNPEKLYKFNLFNATSKKWTEYPGHHNVFLVNKGKYWQAGGYDESFTGHHMGDREFLRRLSDYTKVSKITESLGVTVVRGGRKLVVDDLVDKTTYDDENMIIKVPKKSPSEKDLVGTVKEKINFSYSRLL